MKTKLILQVDIEVDDEHFIFCNENCKFHDLGGCVLLVNLGLDNTVERLISDESKKFRSNFCLQNDIVYQNCLKEYQNKKYSSLHEIFDILSKAQRERENK